MTDAPTINKESKPVQDAKKDVSEAKVDEKKVESKTTQKSETPSGTATGTGDKADVKEQTTEKRDTPKDDTATEDAPKDGESDGKPPKAKDEPNSDGFIPGEPLAKNHPDSSAKARREAAEHKEDGKGSTTGTKSHATDKTTQEGSKEHESIAQKLKGIVHHKKAE